MHQIKKNFMAPFYQWSSTASALEPLWGILLFTNKFPDIHLQGMKDCIDLLATQWFWTHNPWIGKSAP